MLWKYFCIKDLCLHAKVIRRKNLQASSFVKEGKAKPGKAMKTEKKLLYTFSKKKQRQKTQGIDTFLLTKLRSRPDTAQKNIVDINWKYSFHFFVTMVYHKTLFESSCF